MADTVLCTNPQCRQPMTFLGEEHDCYCFGCYHCGSARVITRPRTRDAARYLVQQRRREALVRQLRLNPHRIYSFPGGHQR